jgi:psiF repeat-containing protein
MTIRLILAAIGTVALLSTAQAAVSKPERTAKSLECSKQADAKNVHGKPRKAFMRKCKKA